jgi:undecaprenyl pyrophosphate phosphatase UppP
MFLVGIPAVLVASAVAGGARSPTKIPLRDAILYVGISVAIVVGVVVYAMYHH